GTGAPIISPDLVSYETRAYEASKGVPFTLSIDAGDRPTYQWYHNTVPSYEGATAIDPAENASAATKSYTYTTPTGSAADVRDYFFCVASNSSEGEVLSTKSKIAAVKYVAMQTLIDFEATANEAGTTGGGNMTGISIHEGSTATKETKLSLGTLKLNNGVTGTNPRGFKLDVGGFQAGDVITFAGFIDNATKAARAKLLKVNVDGEGTATSLGVLYDAEVDFVNKNGNASAVPVEYSYTLKAGDLDGTDGYIYVVREGSTSVWLTKIKVTRGDPDEPNMPYITTDINETYETTEGTAVDITMVAEDVDSYAWYTVSSTESYETGKTLIEDATSATCSFKKDDAGTYYVYGVAISGTGEVHKRDTTRIATVTVAEGAPVTKVTYTWDVADWSGEDGKQPLFVTSNAAGVSQSFAAKKEDGTFDATQQLLYFGNASKRQADARTIEGEDWTYYVQSGGASTITSEAAAVRVLKYHAPSSGKITLYARGGSSSGDKKIYINTALSTSGSNARSWVNNDGTSALNIKAEYEIKEESDIYMFFTGGGDYFYGVVAEIDVAAPVYVEKAIYTTNFQDWTKASASTSEPYPTHAARTTSKEDFTFTLFNTEVDNNNAEMNVSPAPSAGALKAAKNGGTAANTAYIKVSSLSNITKIMYVHGATGGSRGWGLKVKGTQENGTVDDDWVTVSSAYAYASSGQKSKSGDTIRVDINRTDCELQFYNLSGNNFAFLNDLKIYGMVEQTSCDEPTAVKGAWQEDTEKWRYTISTTSDDAYLHYTIDGGAEQIYEGASTTLDLEPGAKLVVWAVDPTGSVEASAEIPVTAAAMPTATKPTITIGALNMAAETYPVTMAAGAGETIHYTLDGSEPTDASTTYSSAINVAQGITIKAVAAKTHYANSDVATATTLAFTHPEGDEKIVMDNGAASGKDNKGISYTVDGTYNSGSYSGNSGTGIKYKTNAAVGPTGSDKGFRIYVNDNFIIKKLVFTNFSS
ncbi:MAG: chitobiase/beta-hexosaminidase C-terminal domain-containing protein, partial [Prevotella sp.]|nr:chitobiase/beta-hexosaminidase C-terminal domain-containing protein [Prevotella sp.]